MANAAYNDVILSNGTYTMSISHFSEFRAVLRGDFVEGETTVETSEPVDYERVLRNESDEAQTMEVTYPYPRAMFTRLLSTRLLPLSSPTKLPQLWLRALSRLSSKRAVS